MRQFSLGKKIKKVRVSYSLPESVIARIEAEADAYGSSVSAVAEALILDALDLWDGYNGKLEKARQNAKSPLARGKR